MTPVITNVKSVITKPMLSGKFKDVDKGLDKVSYPVLATPKYDGIRALRIDGHLVSRTFKPIPNDHMRTTCENDLPENLDDPQTNMLFV